MVILKIGRTRHVHYIKEWVYMYLSSNLGRNILSFLLVFFFYLFPLRFPKSWHTCYNGTLEVSLPIVFDLQCLIDPCCCILIRLFFHEELWRLFLALNAMGCFDMCYAISWSIWNNNTPKQQLNISFCLCYFKIVFGLDVETFASFTGQCQFDLFLLWFLCRSLV